MENINVYIPPILAVAVIAQIVSFAFEWRKHKIYVRIILVACQALQLVLVILLFLNNWGEFPWGRASAFKTADSFLTTVQQDDYNKVTEYMVPCAQQLAKLESFGDQSQPRPSSWQWTGYEGKYSSASTIGIAKFSDGTELRIQIDMMWKNYKWTVNGVIFGEPYNDARVQFHC